MIVYNIYNMVECSDVSILNTSSIQTLKTKTKTGVL